MLSRRGFVAGAAAVPLAVRLPRWTWAAGAPLRSFTAAEALVVTEATARLIPGPTDDPTEAGSPGAREANVVGYIDALLAAFDVDPPHLYAGGPTSDRKGSAVNAMATFLPLTALQDRYWRVEITSLGRRYREGISALDAAAGGDFAAATGDRQDRILAADGTGFRDLLFGHAIEGWLANPEYGGNAGGAGWSAVRFPGDSCPDGYTDAAVSAGDGPDPIDLTGATGALLTMLRGGLGATGRGSAGV